MPFNPLNIMPASRWLLPALLWLSAVLAAYSQPLPPPPPRGGIGRINAYADSLSSRLPAEQLYVQTDKALYAPGDTLWFKGYLLEARDLTPSFRSGLVWVELIGKDGQLKKRVLCPASLGLLRGAIPLTGGDLPQGAAFTLRAYTRWMRNWGTDYVFTKELFFATEGAAGTATALKAPRTSAAGATAASPSGGSVTTGAPGNIDLQFMPEGGSLVTGLRSRVGFKALAENGLGLSVSGKIYNSRQQPVAGFQTTHAGMGSFELTPLAGESYVARISTPRGGLEEKTYALPVALARGVVMRVSSTPESQALRVDLAASAGLAAEAPYYLVARSHGVVCYGAVARLTGGELQALLPAGKFPTGLVSITLFDEHLRPLSERLTYVAHRDELRIRLQTGQESYRTRDSVALRVQVTNGAGEPVQGSFSVSVTDDGLAGRDTAGGTILTRMLLTGELRGRVENPAYYLLPGAESRAALDCLLLTQGWVGYASWNAETFKLPPVSYLPRPEFVVQGRLTNLLSKGVAGVPLRLFSRHPAFILDTVSNAAGEFTFRHIPAIDTDDFLLQALSKKGGNRNVGFEVPPQEEPLPLPRLARGEPPLSVFADSAWAGTVQTNTRVRQQAGEVLTGKNVLRAVEVRGKKIIKGSKNLNGPGNSDEALDEKDLLKAVKTPLIDLLRQRITGFHEGMFPMRKNIVASGGITPSTNTDKNVMKPKYSYMVKTLRARFVFDGIDPENSYEPGENETLFERQLYLKSILEQFTAEDIKGIEVMYSSVYNNIYTFNLTSNFEKSSFISPVNNLDYTYLEITTRSGKGPFISGKQGFYTYRPQVPAWPKAFYSPRYASRESNVQTDFRSTLHWEPDLVTDEKGQATLRFFTSNRTGNFTIIAEGADLRGKVGSATGKFTVK